MPHEFRVQVFLGPGPGEFTATQRGLTQTPWRTILAGTPPDWRISLLAHGLSQPRVGRTARLTNR